MGHLKIKRDDEVIIIAGAHKGRTGRVVRVLRDRSSVVVERVNLVKRHVRPRGDMPGGIIEKEAPIHISNVALYSAEEGRPVKVGWKKLDDGRKVRYDKRTGAILD